MSEADEFADHLLIACPTCEGVGQKVRPCTCSVHGDRAVVAADDPVRVGEPFRDCTKCGGTGTTVRFCIDCEGSGRSRAQMVITVINLDTGQVASATIIPGVIEPTPSLVNGRVSGLCELPLQPLVADLVKQVGGAGLRPTRAGIRDEDRLKPITLHGRWRPDLPADEQRQIIAQALVSQRARRHSFFFAASRNETLPKADQQLDRLCRLAEALRVDLRVFYCPSNDQTTTERRWQIDLALPGVQNPIPRPKGNPQRPTLAAAVADAIKDLPNLVNALRYPRKLEDVTPAHQILAPQSEPVNSPGDCDDIAERLQTVAQPGGLAIWRDGGWHYTTLTMEHANQRFYESDNGQIHELVDRVWRVEEPPPAPSYLGKPIPDRACPDCETGTVWKPCRCVDSLDGEAFAGCDACGGTGWETRSDCTLCGNIRRIRYGLTVTLTDLDTFTRHVEFNFEADTTRLPQRQFDIWEDERKQLPEQSRLTRILFDFGIDLADVTAFDSNPPPADLLDGAAMVRANGPADALEHNFTANATRGHPGARIFLRIRPRQPVELDRLIQIAHGVGYDVAIAVEDRSHRSNAGTSLGGTRWGVSMLEPEAALERGTILLKRRYLNAAVTDSVDHLPHLLNLTRKVAATEPLNAPQQPEPPHVDTSGLEAALSALATRYGGVPISTITARIGQGRCVVVRHPSLPEARYMPPEVLAEASDVAAAVAALQNRQG